jgi:hypothetical protein
MPESLLLGHFKALFEQGKLKTIDDVRLAYVRVLGDEECQDPEDYVYGRTLKLFQSADPFSLIALNYESKRRKLCRDSMAHLQR